MSVPPSEPREPDSPEQPGQDDEIIASALRRSAMIAAAALVLVLLAVYLARRPPAPVAVVEAPAQAPMIAEATADAVPPAVTFRDVTAAAGIRFVHTNGAYGESLLPETMGGGVAFFDMDADGDQDLVFVNARQWPWRDGPAVPGVVLYRNDGSGHFEDVTAGSGAEQSLYGMGVAAGDYDADGLPDLFITAVGANRLLRNLGDARFEDVSEHAGVSGADDAWSTSAAFLDYDRDGDLDLFVTNYVQWSRDIDLEVDYQLAGIGRAYGPPTNYAGTNSVLYRNDGVGRYSDVSAAAGVEVSNPATGLPMGKGLGVRPEDIDGDGWLDLLVANDTVRNFVFRNRGDGSFEEIASRAGLAFDNAGSATGAMGIDTAHYANDASLAVAIGNFANEMSSFYVSTASAGLFTDEAIVAGIGPDSRRALSFGLFFFDYDLDGRLDLLQVNGHVEDEINLVQPSQHYAQPAQLFWNCGLGCARHFVPVDEAALGDLARPLVGRGAAYADIDADGDLDVVITQVGAAAVLLRNEQQLGRHWLRVRLHARGANRDAIGARVRLETGGGTQIARVMPSRSYLSQVELPVTFGLGTAPGPGRLVIDWPDGSQGALDVTSPDMELVIVQPGGGD